MHINIIPNRGSPPTVLLRESYREGGKVHKRTLANLSALSSAQVQMIRATLRGDVVQPVNQTFEVIASPAHGHVQAVCLAMQRLDFASMLAAKPCRERDLVLAMVASRIISPATKLATTRLWRTNTLAQEFGVSDANEDDLYAAMDWLLAGQDRIQRSWQHVISRKTAWCSTICLRVTLRVRIVHWPSWVTAVMANVELCRSTMDYSLTIEVVRWRFLFMTAIHRTARRLFRKLRACVRSLASNA